MQVLTGEQGGGIDYESIADRLSIDPIEGTVRVSATNDGRRIKVAYLALDEYPPHEFWAGKAVVQSFDDERARDAFVRARSGWGYPVVGIGRGPTGDRKAEPYDGHMCVISPLISGKRTPQEEVVGHCDRLLRAEEAWEKGKLCGVVVEVFSVSSSGMTRIDMKTQWSHSDFDTASGLRDAAIGLSAETCDSAPPRP